MTQEPDPIVVYGAPRSGTTYFERILDAHPLVTLTSEVRIFEWMSRTLHEVTADDTALLGRREEFRAFLRGALPDLVRGFYRTLEPDVRYWGDKNPHYAWRERTLRCIVELFPGARFVHIVRDLRAVVTSLLVKRHPDGSAWVEFEAAHALAVEHVDRGTRFGASLPATQYHELRYEDLVRDDVGLARRLFAFLGIEFADEVAQFCRRQARERTPFMGPTTDLTHAGSAGTTRDRWRAAIPPEQQRRSLLFLAPLLLAKGYETDASLEREYRSLPDGPTDL